MAGSTMSTVLGQLACYTGQPLKWDDVARSEFQFGPAPDVANFDTPPPSKPDAAGNYPLPKPGLYDDPLKAPKVVAEKRTADREITTKDQKTRCGRVENWLRKEWPSVFSDCLIRFMSTCESMIPRLSCKILPSPWPPASFRPRPTSNRRRRRPAC